ncbi:MAG: hypothetical protein HYR48_03790 [Gemmatimonadetes bacterium]|nr:hypothetical protein [Gemmatimonadota bacterium]
MDWPLLRAVLFVSLGVFMTAHGVLSVLTRRGSRTDAARWLLIGIGTLLMALDGSPSRSQGSLGGFFVAGLATFAGGTLLGLRRPALPPGEDSKKRLQS